MKVKVYTNCDWYSWFSYQRIGTATGGLGKKARGDHPEYRINKISQKTEKSPGDLRKFAVTQTPGRNQSASTDMKNSKSSNSYNYNRIQKEK